MLGGRILAFWFILVLVLPASAWAQRGRYGASGPSHFGGRYPTFQSRGYGFQSPHGHGFQGHSYGFRSYSPYRFHGYYSPFRHYYRPFGYYGYYPRTHFYTDLYFGFGIPPYSYYSVPFYYPYLSYSTYWPNHLDQPPTYEPSPSQGTQAVPEHLWLLALKDSSIQAVKYYWLKDNVLHYVTRDGESSSLPLSQVDLSFTAQLNRERGLEFRLPRPSAE